MTIHKCTRILCGIGAAIALAGLAGTPDAIDNGLPEKAGFIQAGIFIGFFAVFVILTAISERIEEK